MSKTAHTGKLFICFMLTLFQFIVLNAQQPNFHLTLNVDNGLPSNHIYYAITDRYGYLWIATPRGVVKYNGYYPRTFSLADGLPTNDVWGLLEDNKGRVWLQCISDELGYLQNDKFHSTKILGERRTIYPRSFGKTPYGIAFFSNYVSGNTRNNICAEFNDTVHIYTMDKTALGVKATERDSCILLFPGANGEIFFEAGDTVYSCLPNRDSLKIKPLYRMEIIKTLKRQSKYTLSFKDNYCIAFGFEKLQNVFFSVNVLKGTIKKRERDQLTPGEQYEQICIQNTYSNSDHNFYIVTNKNVLKYGCGPDSVVYLGKESIQHLLSTDNTDTVKVSAFMPGDFWGQCVGTVTGGMIVNYDIENNFYQKGPFKLNNYKLVNGSVADSVMFWWNTANHSLLKIEKNHPAVSIPLNLANVTSLVPYNKDTVQIFGSYRALLVLHNGHCKVIENDGNKIGFIDKVAAHTKDTLYAVAADGFIQIAGSVDNPVITVLDLDRYAGLLHLRNSNSYWAYNSYKILIRKNGVNRVLEKADLPRFGVKKIQKIVSEPVYNNIFFKGVDNITMYDEATGVYKNLLEDFNLVYASIYVYKNWLITGGPFGVIFMKINGKLNLSQPIVYPNIKNINYNYINDIQPFLDSLFINTDKGTFKVKIPGDSDISNIPPLQSSCKKRYIVAYDDTIRNFVSGDTVALDQNHLKLQFDVINLCGNGRVRYQYRVADDSVWRRLNAGELSLQGKVIPGSYCRLILTLSDNVWKSGNIELFVYVRPYWWQTGAGKRLVNISIGIGVLLVLAIAVAITRQIVLRREQRRNARLELELKSIYAQLNPHFIFNSLNASLMLVTKGRMEEAYDHISKFSRLLRAYLKSSRTRYISIAGEVDNLEDYMSLQQQRFADKFEYQITVDAQIDADKVSIPTLLVQPFVENAINHGILPLKDKGRLSISFKRITVNEIVCIIDDNGVGRTASGKSINKNKKESYGGAIIRDLAEALRKYDNITIRIKYVDKEPPETGTTVHINIINPANEK